MLSSWRFVRKRAKHKSILKYTRGNIAYYCHFIHFMRHHFGNNMVAVKFWDEASFEARSLHASHGYAAAGEEIIAPANTRGAARALAHR